MYASASQWLALGRDFEAMAASRICAGLPEKSGMRLLTKNVVVGYLTQWVRCPNDPIGGMPDGGASCGRDWSLCT